MVVTINYECLNFNDGSLKNNRIDISVKVIDRAFCRQEQYEKYQITKTVTLRTFNNLIILLIALTRKKKYN